MLKCCWLLKGSQSVLLPHARQHASHEFPRVGTVNIGKVARNQSAAAGSCCKESQVYPRSQSLSRGHYRAASSAVARKGRRADTAQGNIICPPFLDSLNSLAKDSTWILGSLLPGILAKRAYTLTSAGIRSLIFAKLLHRLLQDV